MTDNRLPLLAALVLAGCVEGTNAFDTFIEERPRYGSCEEARAASHRERERLRYLNDTAGERLGNVSNMPRIIEEARLQRERFDRAKSEEDRLCPRPDLSMPE
ncbi:MAG: hypothetical protein OXH76_08370 [Boseongicola sp.]|nr:hypothetical protein [Boseongicola sp.]